MPVIKCFKSISLVDTPLGDVEAELSFRISAGNKFSHTQSDPISKTQRSP